MGKLEEIEKALKKKESLYIRFKDEALDMWIDAVQYMRDHKLGVVVAWMLFIVLIALANIIAK